MAEPHNPTDLPGERSLPEDRQALDDLFSSAYEELRRLASSVRRGDPGSTLSPTALVNEAWLKLAGSPEVARTSGPSQSPDQGVRPRGGAADA